MVERIALGAGLVLAVFTIAACGQGNSRQAAENLCVETNASLNMLLPELNQAEAKGDRSAMAEVLISASRLLENTAREGERIEVAAKQWPAWQLSVKQLSGAYRRAGMALRGGDQKLARSEIRQIKRLQFKAGQQAEAMGLRGCPTRGERP